jgi:hypothetical protein
MRPTARQRTSEPPIPEPELRRAQRARVFFDFTEGDEHTNSAENGWARVLDNGWLLFYFDEGTEWQCWPPHTIVCIDWDFDACSGTSDEDGQR